MCLSANGQHTNKNLEISVIKETLPQLLNNNANSVATYLRDGGGYTLMSEILNLSLLGDTAGVHQTKMDLNKLADSLSEVLTRQKIVVLLSDILFAYRYTAKHPEV